METAKLGTRVENLEKRYDIMETKLEQIYSIKEVLSAIEVTMKNSKLRDELQDEQMKEQSAISQGLILSLEKLNNKIDNTETTLINVETKVDKFIDSNTLSILDMAKDILLKTLIAGGSALITYLNLK